MWAKLDDHYYDNLKILSVSIQARWIHTAAICWCSQHLTDGVIPRRQAWKLGAEDESSRPGEWIDELLRANLFEPSGPDAYRVHDFLEYNPTRADVLEQRAEQERRRQEFLERQKAAGEARAAGVERGNGGRFTSRHASQPASQNTQPAGDPAGGAAGDASSRSTSVNPLPASRIPVFPYSVPERISRATSSPVPADAGDRSPPQGDPEKPEDTEDRGREIREVYQHYLRVMGKTEGTYQLTRKRRAKIATRLRTWDVKALCAAIDACAASEFHMGGNRDGKVYADLADHILRSDEKVEGWVYGRRSGNGSQNR